MLYRKEQMGPGLAAIGVVVVVGVDLWGVGSRYLDEDSFSPTQGVEEQIPRYAFDRFLQQKEQEVGGPGHFRVLPLRRPGGSGLTADGFTPFYHQSLGGYHGAKLQRYQDFLDHIIRTPDGRLNDNAVDMMNARYVLASRQQPGMTVAFQDEQSGVLVLENTDAVPRGYVVGEAEVRSDPEETWARLRNPTFDPRRTAILSEPLDAPLTPIDSASTATASLQSFSPREITWTVETDAPRLFVASEVHYPAGWTATLNGEPVSIERANYLLRAVPIPAGSHTLTMRFAPASHVRGTWISGITTALVYGGVLFLIGLPYIRRRIGSEGATEASAASDSDSPSAVREEETPQTVQDSTSSS